MASSKIISLLMAALLWVLLCDGREMFSEEVTMEECVTATRPVEDIRIVAKETPVPEFAQENLTFLGSVSDYWASVVVLKIGVNSLYCYEGGNVDPNTGCKAASKTFSLTKTELREASEEDLCKVGTRCLPEGSCWGSDADECLEPALSTRHQKESPENLDGVVIPFKRFAYHTCTKSYFCDLKKYSLPIKAGTVDGIQIKFEVEIPNMGVWALSSTESVMRKTNDGYHILLPKITVSPAEGAIGCIYAGDKKERHCIITSGPKKNEIVFLDKGCTASKDNLFLSADCKTRQGEHDTVFQKLARGEDNVEASIRDLHETIKVLIYNNQKANFNLAKTTIQLNLIKRTIKEMIIASSSRDGRYLGLLLGIPSHSEKQIDGSFTLRGCNEPKTNLSCTKHFNFLNGVWRSKKIDSDCDHKPLEEVKRDVEEHDLYLFPEEEVIFDEAQVSKLNGAIMERKRVINYQGIKGYHGISGEEGTGSIMKEVSEYMDPWAMAYRHSTFILAAVSFVMSLIVCIQRR